MNNDPITYETGTYRTNALDYRLQIGVAGTYIEHRKHNSQWWDITYGQANHTQAVWNVIKREGTKILA